MAEYERLLLSVIEKIDEKVGQVSNSQKLLLLKNKFTEALSSYQKDGTIDFSLVNASRLYLESYSDYINNPLLEEMGKLEKLLKGIQQQGSSSTGFRSSNDCNVFIMKSVLGGAKVPHSTSQPVIYEENGKYYLAVFVFFFNRGDIEAGAVDRPTVWAIANLETGEIIKEYETKEKDFSDAPYDKKYNVRSDKKYDTSKEYYDRAFDILDSVRKKLIKEHHLYKAEYQYYLDKILANIPEKYQRFYTDLSV